MKPSNPRSAFSPVLIGIALAAMTQISYAAGDVASELRTTGLTQAAQRTPATARVEPRSADRASSLTLYLEDTSGKTFRLVQVPGTGWKYADGWKSSERKRNSLFQETAFKPNARATAAKEAVAHDESLTVFIDGPSGFTFVWNQDEGWKFVGKIANSKP